MSKDAAFVHEVPARIAVPRSAKGLRGLWAADRRAESMTDMHARVWSAILVLVMATGAPPAAACTLFAAAGPRVQGGGVLIAKTRDWRPIQTHTLRRVADSGAFPYVGLFAEGGDAPGLKAGVNSHGLVVVSATAPVPRQERRAAPRTAGLLAKLLASSASVEEALQHRDWFLGPRFLLLADRHTVASVEIAPGGQLDIQTTSATVLSHTNHYVAPTLRQYNPARVSASSQARYQRTAQLQAQPEPLGVDDFIRFSDDRVGGPDDAIWREGSSSTRTRTLVAWIVSLPPLGEPQLYVKVADPGAPVIVRRLGLGSDWP